MKSWKRITLIVFVLIGGAISFGYWFISQFDIALDNISAPYLANLHSVYPVRDNASNGANPPKDGLASASLETFGEPTSSTDSKLASTSLETSVTPAIFTTDSKLSFTFPQKSGKVYIGCTYPISWQPATLISSLEAALIDAGAKETVEPKTSGLAKENTIEKESQNLNWKVGFSVWPGTYYIKVSKINGVEAEFRSKVFKISPMPKGISADEKEKNCVDLRDIRK